MEDRVRASAAIAVSRDPRLRAALATARENDAARVREIQACALAARANAVPEPLVLQQLHTPDPHRKDA
eukprot:4832387-Heterocapsa_arctica.AAC.1